MEQPKMEGAEEKVQRLIDNIFWETGVSYRDEESIRNLAPQKNAPQAKIMEYVRFLWELLEKYTETWVPEGFCKPITAKWLFTPFGVR